MAIQPTAELKRTNAQHWRRYRKLMAWMLAFSLVVLVLVIGWLAYTGTTLRPQFLIAVSLGVVLSLMLGTGLMGLVYVSARTGADDGVAELPERESGEER